MSVKIETTHKMTVDGQLPWLVPEKLLRQIGGITYFKFSACNPSIVRLVYEAKQHRLSMSSSIALLELKKLRNKIQHDVFLAESGSAAEASFFGEAAVAKPKKMSKTDRNQLKANPEVMDVPVTVGGVATSIKILRPLHPLEDIHVEFTEEALGVIIRYVRERDGTGASAVAGTRSYKKHTDGDGERLWNMGGGRKACRIDGKLKYISKTKSTASSAATEHDEEEDDRNMDCPSGTESVGDANPGGEASASGAEDQQNMLDESS
jgi:hypothetical protein